MKQNLIFIIIPVIIMRREWKLPFLIENLNVKRKMCTLNKRFKVLAFSISSKGSINLLFADFNVTPYFKSLTKVGISQLLDKEHHQTVMIKLTRQLLLQCSSIDLTYEKSISFLLIKFRIGFSSVIKGNHDFSGWGTGRITFPQLTASNYFAVFSIGFAFKSQVIDPSFLSSTVNALLNKSAHMVTNS